ncbi:glycerol-3-phosphate 1-O-acyltransferase PlsY [candidate division KSB1 bacterium]
MTELAIIIVLSYLIGSIPTSVIAGKLFKGIDIRKHGSGNAGATNVVRVMGWKIGVGVLLLDMAKGFVATYYFSQIGMDSVPLDHSIVQLIAGFTAVFGHIWSVFVKFKGGKGVATAGGMAYGLAPLTISLSLVVFLIFVIPTRYVSLGSIMAAVSFSTIMVVRKFGMGHDIPMPIIYFAFFATALFLYTHRTNIKRLLNGTENKFKKS